MKQWRLVSGEWSVASGQWRVARGEDMNTERKLKSYKDLLV